MTPSSMVWFVWCVLPFGRCRHARLTRDSIWHQHKKAFLLFSTVGQKGFQSACTNLPELAHGPDNCTRLKNNRTRLKIDIFLVILRQTAEQYDVNWRMRNFIRSRVLSYYPVLSYIKNRDSNLDFLCIHLLSTTRPPCCLPYYTLILSSREKICSELLLLVGSLNLDVGAKLVASWWY